MVRSLGRRVGLPRLRWVGGAEPDRDTLDAFQRIIDGGARVRGRPCCCHGRRASFAVAGCPTDLPDWTRAAYPAENDNDGPRSAPRFRPAELKSLHQTPIL